MPRSCPSRNSLLTCAKKSGRRTLVVSREHGGWVILLDTTVLVYAVGADHPLAEPARDIIRQIQRGSLRAHTTPEVIQEFAHVRAKYRDRTDATEVASAYATLLAPLVPVMSHHLAAGLDLWKQHEKIGAFDSVLAAVARAHDAELISADRAFADVPLLRWRDLNSFTPPG